MSTTNSRKRKYTEMIKDKDDDDFKMIQHDAPTDNYIPPPMMTPTPSKLTANSNKKKCIQIACMAMGHWEDWCDHNGCTIFIPNKTHSFIPDLFMQVMNKLRIINAEHRHDILLSGEIHGDIGVLFRSDIDRLQKTDREDMFLVTICNEQIKTLTLSVAFGTIGKYHFKEISEISEYEGPSEFNSTKLAITMPPKHSEIIGIVVKPTGCLQDEFVIYALYSETEKSNNLIKTATTYVQHKLYQKYRCVLTVKATETWQWKFEITQKKEYLMNDPNPFLIFLSLHINFVIEYEHKVKDVNITCTHMIKAKSDNPLKCPIYCAVKQEYQFNKANYHHLRDHYHLKNEFKDKPQCRYSSECEAYIRQQKGGDRIDDQCHMMTYRHPPRTRNIELARNMHSFVFNKSKTDNRPLYKPNKNDTKQYKYNSKDGYLKALIAEVKANQFAYDLCLDCGDSDDCKHSEHSILKIVDETLNHTRHKQILSPLRRDEMLALILYTGCDCNHDLCKQQRNGNYHKWKWFDFCLYKAITKLSGKERGEFVVYSGLNGVKMNRKSVRSGYFATYMSTAWQKEVAKEFMDGDGMIVAIDKKFKNDRAIKCCDVSWISKFPDECEVLFARSLEYKANNGFVCDVMDDTNGVQMICLKKKRKQ
eukprot:240394_1